jgi:pantoate kinase
MMPKDSEFRRVFVPCAVSSFFEICDREADGSPINDLSRVGARGGGFVIDRGTVTTAETNQDLKADRILINGVPTSEARTTESVIRLIRKEHDIPFVQISHKVDSPIGSGFGTSGAGALGTSCAISKLFNLKLTLAGASLFAHKSEILSVTGLGTVISLTSGIGSCGLVTEPGSYSVGRVDSILLNDEELTLICAVQGPIEKTTVLKDEAMRIKVNEFGRSTLEAILNDPTPETLLDASRVFAEKTGIGTRELLWLADKSIEAGALGATQNMLGNAVHCLVPKTNRNAVFKELSRHIHIEGIFEAQLVQSGPHFLD